MKVCRHVDVDLDRNTGLLPVYNEGLVCVLNARIDDGLISIFQVRGQYFDICGAPSANPLQELHVDPKNWRVSPIS